TVSVACRAASTSVDEVAKIISTSMRTNSAARSGSCSIDSVHRNSMTRSLAQAPAVPRPKNPIRKTFLGGCARAANGRAAAVVLSRVMKSRHLIAALEAGGHTASYRLRPAYWKGAPGQTVDVFNLSEWAKVK